MSTGVSEDSVSKEPAQLTFPRLDELIIALDKNIGVERYLEQTTGLEVGPLAELAGLSRDRGRAMLKLLVPTSASVALRSVLERSDVPNYSTKLDGPVEFRRITKRSADEHDPVWISFLYRLQLAAEASGLPRRVAQGLAGALGEIEDNVQIHSEAAETGIVGFRTDRGRFEFTAIDVGIGVLDSLRQHSDYLRLRDSGEALKVALTDGESRFGRAAGRGNGFRELFRGIANRGGHLRCRSGDHVLEIAGANLLLVDSRLIQRPYFRGLAITVVLRP